MSYLNIGSQICSNLALVITKSRSLDCAKPKMLKLVSATFDNNSFTFLHFSLTLLKADLSFEISMRFFYLNYSTQYSTNFVSKSYPPRWVFPLVDFTSFTPSPIHSTDTSKVPPPKSKTKMFLSSTVRLLMSKAKLAAVGSLIILKTFKPAILPASYVAIF